MGRFLTASLLLAALAAPAIAQKCGGGSLCPSDAPCCSQYGQCGTGAYCLGGCDPLNSFKLDACVPMPQCVSKKYDFNDLNNVQANTKYLGDASKADWSSSGEPVEYSNTALLTMAQGTVGTLMALNHYVWYGKISARMKTSAGAGVVTAFILLSDTKDEIDFEFVGTDLKTAQTNFYSLGITNYNNGKYLPVPSDTMANYHEYTIDWSPDTLKWIIDGNVVRTLNKKDTWNSTSNRYSYPVSPARVQLSLWPAGLPTNPKGTVDWAGGEIQWNSPYMTNGYYYSQFDYVNVECYNAPSGVKGSGKNSYVLTNSNADEGDFSLSNNPTVLGSFLATGLDMDKGKTEQSNGASNTANTVPGMTGAGPGVAPSGSGGSSNGDSASSTQSAAQGKASNTSGGGFQQGSSGAANVVPPEKLGGSIFAVVVALIGLCML